MVGVVTISVTWPDAALAAALVMDGDRTMLGRGPPVARALACHSEQSTAE